MIWIPLIVLAVIVLLPLASGVGPGWIAAKDRLGALVSIATAALCLVIGRALVDWSVFPGVVWYALVVIAAAGAFVLVLRMPALPWVRDPSKRGRRYTDAGVTLGLVLAFALVTSV